VSDALPLRLARDVDAVLRDARVAAPAGSRRQRCETDDLSVELGDEPQEVRRLPGLPRWNLGLERRKTVAHAVPVDLREARPVVRAHVADLDSCRGG